MKQIEILYFESCPGWKGTVERVHQVVADGELDHSVTVRAVPVETEEDAVRLQFVGSPTVRVNGQDVDPSASSKMTYGLQCRLYDNAGRIEKLPPSDMIRSALGLSPVGT